MVWALYGQRNLGNRLDRMLDTVQLLAGTNLLLLAFSVLIFDIPRYTLSLVSLALQRWSPLALQDHSGRFPRP